MCAFVHVYVFVCVCVRVCLYVCVFAGILNFILRCLEYPNYRCQNKISYYLYMLMFFKRLKPEKQSLYLSALPQVKVFGFCIYILWKELEVPDSILSSLSILCWKYKRQFIFLYCLAYALRAGFVMWFIYFLAFLTLLLRYSSVETYW